MDEVLRQQLRDIARQAVPEIDWKDHVQGAEAFLGDFRLSLYAGGSNDNFVWLGLKRKSENTFIYHRELRHGSGVTSAQGGANPRAPMGDPFEYLGTCLQEAHQVLLSLYTPPETTGSWDDGFWDDEDD